MDTSPGVRQHRWLGTAIGLALSALAVGAPAGSAAQEAALQRISADDLGELSLDELSQISVTSASKRAESLEHAAASLYVINGDVIRRSGVMSIPEVLRYAPNLEVLRIDALDYSITARGFAGFEAANKLLVLIDGRSVYTPMYSGVDWDQHHTLLEDVDRIEVISGPGGALWGANAVNGVVNLTTRSAFYTLGGVAAANVGSQDQDIRLRYGAPLGQSAAVRVYGTAFKRADLRAAGGDHAMDGWNGWLAGFRGDWARGGDSFTLQGDLQRSTIDESLGIASGFVKGGNALARWRHVGRAGRSLEIQAYYDQIEREARLTHDELRTWDAEAQYSFDLGRHAIILGAGYRRTRDEFRTLTEPQLLSPPSRKTAIANVFVQDQISLSGSVKLTLGLKLEDNTYTRSEWLPSARLGWAVNDKHFLWAAVSRAVRNPSRIERDFVIAGVVVPGRMGSEELVAMEVGYRGRLAGANLSVSAYFDDYDGLRSNNLTAPGVLPIYVGNTLNGEVYGIEAWLDLDVRPWWRISLGGSLIGKDIAARRGDLDLSANEAAGVDPSYWFKARSQMQLTERLQLDLGLRVYDDIPTSAASGYLGAPGYVEADARLAWRMNDRLELFLKGENLLHDQHPEASEARRSEIPRSGLVGLRWSY